MSERTQELDSQILSLIGKGVDKTFHDADFNKIALELFQYQFSRNLPYQQYCKNIQKTPEKISNWKEIPAIPTSAFKEVPLSCFQARKAKKVFYTSGTTFHKSGRHYLQSLDLYENSLRVNFKASFLIENEKWPLLILTPSPGEEPHSSLSHMMGVLKKNIGTEESTYFFQKGKFLINLFQKMLKKFSSAGAPVLILGTAFSFVHFLDEALKKRWKISLPPGSRIMETGGYKGKSRELKRHELYQLISRTFGVPLTHIINEYGMTEMGSQFYDNTLSYSKKKNQTSRFKMIPPWVRTRIVNPYTLQEVSEGETGLLQHFDLANRSSVMALLTEDMGIKIKEGFEILGRSPLAQPRGCSMGVADWINPAASGGWRQSKTGSW